MRAENQKPSWQHKMHSEPIHSQPCQILKREQLELEDELLSSSFFILFSPCAEQLAREH